MSCKRILEIFDDEMSPLLYHRLTLKLLL